MNDLVLRDKADELWSQGRHHLAFRCLMEILEKEPERLDVRELLAERYRELGNPDHAGRWGIAIDGWTTDLERDRLARLLAARRIEAPDIRAFLMVSTDQVSAEALSEIAAVADRYRDRHAVKDANDVEAPRMSAWEVGVLLGVLAAITTVIGALLVFAFATFGEAPAALARITALVPVGLATSALLVSAAGAIREKELGIAAALFLPALILLGAVVTAFLTGWALPS